MAVTLIVSLVIIALKMATDTMQEIRKIFNMAQDGVNSQKLCEMLSPLQSSADEEEFWLAFLNHVQKTMIYYKSETVVERVISFIAAFSTYATVKKSKEQVILTFFHFTILISMSSILRHILFWVLCV